MVILDKKNRKKVDLGKYYKVKTIQQEGVTCVSIGGSGLTYRNAWHKNEPKGKLSERYRDKTYNRGKVLRKLGLWENIQRGTSSPKNKRISS